ncbi:DUF1259 domain-containing protein [Bacillus suaedaesalsae]|uniref:DUF1259 domain-containing protein n=1 Tax=Bacillus suaedaesalsae TaxID=2810349 RepID=A0ABS2DKD9_9BACI|nr:DUF1259 domain-containing protein [Bacillus suaedaesalsae]MBM6618966.1 DUF1259 domain-containing protein [Bacillus suaedaesalsae]
MKKYIVFISCLVLMSFPALTHAQKQLNCNELQLIFNTKVESENGICSVEMFRKTIDVTHMDKKLSPKTMELVFHFSFEQVDNKHTAVMGELALLEEEVNPVMDELRKGGLEVSALHNHMIHERPRIMYMHFQGIGDMNKQAKTIKRAIDKTSK